MICWVMLLLSFKNRRVPKKCIENFAVTGCMYIFVKI